MEKAHKPVLLILNQLKQLATMLNDTVWTLPIEVLSGASTGQHVRHILGLFQQLQLGYETGLVNYDLRERHTASETSVEAALSEIDKAISGLKPNDKPLVLEYQNPAGRVQIQTNYARELHYCLEHAIHHMAIVKAGLKSHGAEGIPDDLGVAFSTLAYRSNLNAAS